MMLENPKTKKLQMAAKTSKTGSYVSSNKRNIIDEKFKNGLCMSFSDTTQTATLPSQPKSSLRRSSNKDQRKKNGSNQQTEEGSISSLISYRHSKNKLQFQTVLQPVKGTRRDYRGVTRMQNTGVFTLKAPNRDNVIMTTFREYCALKKAGLFQPQSSNSLESAPHVQVCVNTNSSEQLEFPDNEVMIQKQSAKGMDSDSLVDNADLRKISFMQYSDIKHGRNKAPLSTDDTRDTLNDLEKTTQRSAIDKPIATNNTQAVKNPKKGSCCCKRDRKDSKSKESDNEGQFSHSLGEKGEETEGPEEDEYMTAGLAAGGEGGGTSDFQLEHYVIYRDIRRNKLYGTQPKLKKGKGGMHLEESIECYASQLYCRTLLTIEGMSLSNRIAKAICDTINSTVINTSDELTLDTLDPNRSRRATKAFKSQKSDFFNNAKAATANSELTTTSFTETTNPARQITRGDITFTKEKLSDLQVLQMVNRGRIFSLTGRNSLESLVSDITCQLGERKY